MSSYTIKDYFSSIVEHGGFPLTRADGEYSVESLRILQSEEGHVL